MLIFQAWATSAGSSAAFQRRFLRTIEFHWVEKFRNMYLTV